MYIKVQEASYLGNNRTITMRCPHCKKMCTFDPVGNDWSLGNRLSGVSGVGLRLCPDPECRALIFVIFDQHGLVRTYPAERLDFDSSHIPGEIVKAVEEAITCHANGCYTAAAMMIRRSLELLCEVQEVHEENLKKRIEALGKSITVPKELLAAMDKLRLLGNDASHVEAKTFTKIGKDQVEAAMDFLKEILKATYQYKGLLEKLAGLEKPSVGASQ